MNISDWVQEMAAAEIQAEAAKIETACEVALQEGVCGVLVLRRGRKLISSAPDPSVPYGQIYERVTL